MNYIQHPPTVKVLIEEVIHACDDYLARKITDDELKAIVMTWAKTSGDKLFSGPSEFNPTLTIRVGKKRIKIIKAMLTGF
ncbi:MAG: hypothetical protein H6Q72_2712 [Firmicutes bacterium]|nr:hypothetical protein [Bacillota bacterium]